MKLVQNILTKRYNTINDSDKIPKGFTDILDEKIKGVWNGIEWVETATQEEIEAIKNQNQKNVIENINAQFQKDGEQFYNDIKTEITILLIGKLNAIPMMLEIKSYVYPMLDQIKEGNFPLAMLDYMDGKNNPSILEVVELFIKVGEYATNYYQTKYPHEPQ